MIYQKTALGLQAMKDRSVADITRNQRAVLILLDGVRTTSAVLSATGTLGVSSADIDVLAERGLIAAIQTGRPAANEAPVTDFASSTLAAKQGPMTLPVAPNNDQERVRRYQKAYPLATQLTASLGLRGFRLNLAVEAADGFEGLVELLPKLRTAVGEERLAPLKAALEGK